MKKIRGWRVLALLSLAFALPPILMLFAWVIAGVSLGDIAYLRGLGSFVIAIFFLAGACVLEEGNK